jgi:hypothetical protein
MWNLEREHRKHVPDEANLKSCQFYQKLKQYFNENLNPIVQNEVPSFDTPKLGGFHWSDLI